MPATRPTKSWPTEVPEAARRLPWLLATPFRYGFGRPSGFRSTDTWPGIFYASEGVETAVTEAAFARSSGLLRPRTPTPMSDFSVLAKTPRALDLTRRS